MIVPSTFLVLCFFGRGCVGSRVIVAFASEASLSLSASLLFDNSNLSSFSISIRLSKQNDLLGFSSRIADLCLSLNEGHGGDFCASDIL